jgi:hypothetical protein
MQGGREQEETQSDASEGAKLDYCPYLVHFICDCTKKGRVFYCLDEALFLEK